MKSEESFLQNVEVLKKVKPATRQATFGSTHTAGVLQSDIKKLCDCEDDSKHTKLNRATLKERAK